jgi:hypothetical protein
MQFEGKRGGGIERTPCNGIVELAVLVFRLHKTIGFAECLVPLKMT